jgi:hypothetical protein
MCMSKDTAYYGKVKLSWREYFASFPYFRRMNQITNPVWAEVFGFNSIYIVHGMETVITI